MRHSLNQGRGLIIIFLGAPGAGKGTQTAAVAQELGLAHISSGDLFRQAVERGDELGLKVKSYMEKGGLVPDEITTQMVLDRLSLPSAKGGVILDGFPRNLAQAESLDKALETRRKSVQRVVYIRVTQAELMRRLASRWLCRSCQTPYARQIVRPESQDRCQKCGGDLHQRDDDSAETVEKRLRVYFRETSPLIEYYCQQGKLVEIEGEGAIAQVTQRIVASLR